MEISNSRSFSEALVIIPTYNERCNIEDVIKRVLQLPVRFDVLIVDDNSPDGTALIVEGLMKQEDRLDILKRPGKQGLGTAYIAGFKYALEKQYKFVFEMDADLSHDPNELPNFIKAMESADLVVGSRYITGVNVVNWPLSRLLLSYFASVYVRVITGLPVRDATSGFICYRCEVLREIDLGRISSGGYSFQIEMKWNAWMQGFRIKEIPIIFVDRSVGQSKMSKAIVREAITLVWKLFFKGIIRKRKVRV